MRSSGGVTSLFLRPWLETLMSSPVESFRPRALPGSSPTRIRSWDDALKHAAKALEIHAPPDRHDERWLYTRAQDFLPPLTDSGEIAASPESELGTELTPPTSSEEVLLLEDGKLGDPEARRRDGLRHGVTLRTMREAWSEDPALMKRIALRSPIRDRYFVWWNTAHLDDGYVVVVSRERPHHRPLQILWRSPNALAVRRLLLILEPGARLDLVECEAARPNQLRHLVRDIHLEREATLHHALLDVPGVNENWLWTTGVVADEKAAYHALGVHAGARKARHEICVDLIGARAHATLDAAVLLPSKHVFDLQTEIVHRADATESRQLVHAATSARATAVYGGTIVVESATKGVVAHQQSRGLLLDPASDIDSRPELHIRSDDVLCTHGASIGAIDPEGLFYLQSRGLNASQARALLLRAFALRVLETFPAAASAALRTTLAERLEVLVRLLVPEAGL